MKNILLIAGLCSALFFQACDTTERPENKTAVDQVDPGSRESSNLNDAGLPGSDSTAAAASDANMAYICPMKCEGSASMQPGKCPVCKMDLVKNPNYKGTTGNTNAVDNEVLNHESEKADDKNMDDKLEKQPK